jgi:hypothetical protein
MSQIAPATTNATTGPTRVTLSAQAALRAG